MSDTITKSTNNGAVIGIKPTMPSITNIPAKPISDIHFLGTESELRWYAPAVRREVEAEARGLLDELKHYLKDQQPAVWRLKWDFVLRARAACEELESVEYEAQLYLDSMSKSMSSERAQLDSELQSLIDARAEIYGRLCVSRAAFGMAMADAHLPWQGGEPTPSGVENAIQEAAPTVTELAGKHQIAPPDQVPRKSWLMNLIAGLWAPASAAITGFLIALCLGSVVGMVTIAALKRGDFVQLAIVAAAGFVIVSSTGKIFENATTPLFYAREKPPSEQLDVAPKPRRGPVIAIYVGTAIVLWVAEVVAEALGMRLLFEQARDIQLGNFIADPGMTPYYLAGMLVSGPFIWAKTVRVWCTCEEQLRYAWLSWMRFQAVASIRATKQIAKCFEEASNAMERAHELSVTETRIKELADGRNTISEPALSAELRSRLDLALAAALGESQRLHNRINALLNPESAIVNRKSVFGL